MILYSFISCMFKKKNQHCLGKYGSLLCCFGTCACSTCHSLIGPYLLWGIFFRELSDFPRVQKTSAFHLQRAEDVKEIIKDKSKAWEILTTPPKNISEDFIDFWLNCAYPRSVQRVKSLLPWWMKSALCGASCTSYPIMPLSASMHKVAVWSIQDPGQRTYLCPNCAL